MKVERVTAHCTVIAFNIPSGVQFSRSFSLAILQLKIIADSFPSLHILEEKSKVKDDAAVLHPS